MEKSDINYFIATSIFAIASTVAAGFFTWSTLDYIFSERTLNLQCDVKLEKEALKQDAKMYMRIKYYNSSILRGRHLSLGDAHFEKIIDHRTAIKSESMQMVEHKDDIMKFYDEKSGHMKYHLLSGTVYVFDKGNESWTVGTCKNK